MATGHACSELPDVGGMVSGMTRPGTAGALARPARRRVAQLAGPLPGGPAPDTAAVELLSEHDIWLTAARLPRRHGAHIDEDGPYWIKFREAATSTTGATSKGFEAQNSYRWPQGQSKAGMLRLDLSG